MLRSNFIWKFNKQKVGGLISHLINLVQNDHLCKMLFSPTALSGYFK